MLVDKSISKEVFMPWSADTEESWGTDTYCSYNLLSESNSARKFLQLGYDAAEFYKMYPKGDRKSFIPKYEKG